MAKRKHTAYMTAGEQVAGTAFFVIYLVVLPFAAGPLFRLAGNLLGMTISDGLQNVLTYYILFAVSIIIFHGFLARTSRQLADNLGAACKAVAGGLGALYGLNELVYRLTNLLVGNRTNLNNTTISAQIDHLEEVTRKIIDQVVAQPQKLPQIRRFLDYYLPTTLKILNAYDRMDAVGVAGDNISSTKERVERMMGTIVKAFDKQLDALFGAEAMDISTDITVMENLLAQEGLAGDGKKTTKSQDSDVTLEL